MTWRATLIEEVHQKRMNGAEGAVEDAMNLSSPSS
jgi:hypothetical protein